MPAIRALALPLLAAAALASTTAHADPFVGRVGTAETTVRLRGTDGKAYQVSFTVTGLTPQGGTPTYTLDVGIIKCVDGSCAGGRRYSTHLSASQITATADFTSVDVHVTVLGAPLSIVWAASQPDDPTTAGVVVSAAAVDGNFNASEHTASVRARLWGAVCRADGTYTDPYTVSVDGYSGAGGPMPPRSVPPQFVTHGTRRTACAS